MRVPKVVTVLILVIVAVLGSIVAVSFINTPSQEYVQETNSPMTITGAVHSVDNETGQLTVKVDDGTEMVFIIDSGTKIQSRFPVHFSYSGVNAEKIIESDFNDIQKDREVTIEVDKSEPLKAKVISILETGQIEIQGEVVGRDAIERTMTIQLESGEKYVLSLPEETTIKRSLTHTNGDDTSVYSEEVNITDIPTSTIVTIFPETPYEEGMTIFPKVKEIFWGTFDVQTAPLVLSASNVVIPAVVSEINTAKGSVLYEIAPPFSEEVATLEVLIRDVRFFEINDSMRAHIQHARRSISISELQAGSSVVLVSKKVDFIVGDISTIQPFEVVIVKPVI